MEIYNQQFPPNSRVIQISDDFTSSGVVVNCLLKVADVLEALGPYHAAEMWLHDYTEEQGGGNLAISYWLIDDEQVAAVDLLKASYPKNPKVNFEVHKEESGRLHMIQIQATRSFLQDRIEYLLRELAEELNKYPISRVLDITLNDVADANDVECPLVRVYFLI